MWLSKIRFDESIAPSEREGTQSRMRNLLQQVHPNHISQLNPGVNDRLRVSSARRKNISLDAQHSKSELLVESELA
jgi:hypothetical protein